ncbi:hypothetical protein ACFOU2_17275 [Bacillus songklensis]|uniref:BH1974-like central domain-containing protein n=1 Tax=Bacillus songklensis TaxID=1069116 RepID=A0ABV8B474_9BACI
MRDEGKTETIAFDMRSYDDLSWGQGAGCNGVIHVLLEPVDVRMRRHLYTLKSYLEAGKPVMMVKKFTDNFTVSDYLFFVDGKRPFGEWQGKVPNEVKDFRRKSGITFVPELDASFYIHCFQPKPRLIVFGAEGPEEIAVSIVAQLIQLYRKQDIAKAVSV